MPLRLDHIAIHCRDMEASARFYGEVLGLEEVADPMGPGPFRWFALAPGIHLHLAAGNAAPLPADEIKTHIALSAADFDATLARLEAANVAFGAMPGRPGRVTTRADGTRQCFVRDPDGHTIEINDAHGGR
jgi:lactoylglutathione lyase